MPWRRGVVGVLPPRNPFAHRQSVSRSRAHVSARQRATAHAVGVCPSARVAFQTRSGPTTAKRADTYGRVGTFAGLNGSTPTMAKTPKNSPAASPKPAAAKSAARNTDSGPSQVAAAGGRPRPPRRPRRPNSWPPPCRPTRPSPPSTASPTAWRRSPAPRCEPASRLPTGQHAVGRERLRQDRQRGARRPATPPSSRWTACASTPAARRSPPTRACAIADNQNSLKYGTARAGAAGRLHPAREDHALRPRAHPRAHRARARLRRARLLRVLRAADRHHQGRAVPARPARSRRCSCASPPWRASAAPRTPRATCAASRSSSTPTKATGTWWATTCRCSSSRTR